MVQPYIVEFMIVVLYILDTNRDDIRIFVLKLLEILREGPVQVDTMVVYVQMELPIRDEKVICRAIRDDVINEDRVMELPVMEENIIVLAVKDEAKIQVELITLVKMVEQERVLVLMDDTVREDITKVLTLNVLKL